MPLLAASTNQAGGVAFGLVFIIIGIAAYFIPGIIGSIRRVPNTGSVWVVNIFLGWTIVGWIIALAMAVRSQTMPGTVRRGWQQGGPLPTGRQPWNPTQPFGLPEQFGQTQPFAQPTEQQPWEGDL